MSHLIFLTKKVGRNQNQGETSQGEMSQGEMSVREKCLLADFGHWIDRSSPTFLNIHVVIVYLNYIMTRSTPRPSLER